MKHILLTTVRYAVLTTFILLFTAVGCRTHKPFTPDLSARGLLDKMLGTERIYNASVGAVQRALLSTFAHFGNRVNVEGALVDDAYFSRFSYLLAQGIRTQVQLYHVDLDMPMVFRATYPTHELSILKIKENVYRVYLWVEEVSTAKEESNTLAKTRVRMLIDEEPPRKEYQISPRNPKYTEAQFLDYIDKTIFKAAR